MAQTKVNINDFSPQELYQLRQGFQSEIQTFSQTLGTFRYAQEKYEQGKRALKAAEDIKPEQEMLIPLSNALYIEGTMANMKDGKRVYMIEYGAGFFVELNVKEGVDFYQRKINLIKDKMGKLQQILGDRREQAKQVELRIMTLMQAQQAQGQAQQVK